MCLVEESLATVKKNSEVPFTFEEGMLSPEKQEWENTMKEKISS